MIKRVVILPSVVYIVLKDLLFSFYCYLGSFLASVLKMPSYCMFPRSEEVMKVASRAAQATLCLTCVGYLDANSVMCVSDHMSFSHK